MRLPFRSLGQSLGRSVGSVVLAGTLFGCTVGPDFTEPAKPAAERYISAAEVVPPNDAGQGAPRQTTVEGGKIAADWWTLFHSEDLDSLVKTAIAGNRTLEGAKARLASAREAVIAANGGLYPQLDFHTGVSRQKINTSSFGLKPGSIALPPNFNLYSVGATASFDPDIFGGTRRFIEQQSAQADFQGYQLDAAYLSLTGNAVLQAIQVASLRAQLQAVDDITDIDQSNLDLVRKSRDAGVAPDSDVVSAEAQLATDETLRPPLRQQLSQARHSLAVIVGKAPGEWLPPNFNLTDLALPGELPVSLPSALVRQRPDILAAEAKLHAASAAIGVATAHLYPDITLSASAGQAALSTGALFDKSSFIWSLAAGLTAPVFHGGTLEAERRAAVDDFKGTLADYEQTVLVSFGQVADLLQALAHDAQLLRTQQRALTAASEAVRLQRLGYSGGGQGIIPVLDAERQYQQARLGYVRAEAQRYQDTVQLFVAMGGGWWNADIVKPQQDAALSPDK
jgi:NodT family efflux transporter outer membrane factor (OMF) lipoprotein